MADNDARKNLLSLARPRMAKGETGMTADAVRQEADEHPAHTDGIKRGHCCILLVNRDLSRV